LPGISGKNIFLYFGYFIIGFCIATNEKIMETIEKCRLVYSIIAILGIICYFTEIYTMGLRNDLGFRIGHYLLYWTTILAMLGYGKHFLNKKSKFLVYFNPASFPVYILHQTYLVIVGYYVLKIINHGIISYVLIMLITLSLTISTYEIIRRAAGKS
jgi:peptidoglycan/LPS O-acetylase OafA/YrhL